MKKYLIRIESVGSCADITINGDSRRPFMIAHNLYNYTTPGHAARRLEKLARSWEAHGIKVKRVYGTVADMPATGDAYNVAIVLADYKVINKTISELVKEYYHY